MVVFGLIIGILVFAGFLALHAVFLVPPPCTSTFGCTPQTPESAAYAGTVQALAWTSVVALDLAVGLSVAFAFVLGSRSDLPESMRRASFLFATVFVVSWVGFSIFFYRMVGAFVRYL